MDTNNCLQFVDYYQCTRIRVKSLLLLLLNALTLYALFFFPSNLLVSDGKPIGVRTALAPIPAFKEDFSRMKLTSFDKLLERTCSLIKNVRLCSEPDQRPGGSAGVAPDAA